jgi:S1-C subfamily serine protease
MIKTISKRTLFILMVLFFGGFGGIIADRYLFPYLSTSSFFSRYEFLKKGSENITVINKTEQVVLKEETSINKITNQISSSVVNIISYPEDDASKKTAVKKAASVPADTAKNGTGVVVTGDGLIMTYVSAINAEKSKYKVMTYDGNMYDAELAGIDAYSGLAFLKAQAGNLSAGSFENSDDIKPGEKVIAIANNSNSYANRYAAGIISSFNPSLNLSGTNLSSSEKLEGAYEADFDFQSYFIGGPVVDYNGQIVGIAGNSQTGSSNSFFVIPSNKVKNVIDRAIKKELDKDPILGIYYVPISKTYAVEKNLGVENGALIYSASGQQGLAVIKDSPAQKAGLKIGDVIVSVGDQKVDAEHSLSDILYLHKKGDSVELTVLRDGQENKISVEL